MNENQRNTVVRFAIVFFAMVALFLWVIGKIIHTQTVEREFWMTAAKPIIDNSGRSVPAHRGNIYDCNGKLLATSIRLYTVSMDTQTEALIKENGQLFKENIGPLCDSLAAYFQDKSAKEYKAAFLKAYKEKNRNFRFYGRKTLTYEQFQVVKKMPLFNKGKYTGGLKYEERTVRIKPFGTLASRSIGNIYGENKKGHHGIEKEFEKELHGIDGYTLRNLSDNLSIDFDTREAQNGLDVVTTIDADLQDVVDNNLRQQLAYAQADWGCCILMEVKTGEVKAISNLTRKEDGTFWEKSNYAVTKMEPGSTFKTYALMAALDDGKVEITDPIDVENGKWKYYNADINDAHNYKREQRREPKTMREAFAISSNVALSKLVVSAYEGKASRFVERMERMGICDSVYFEIPGKSQPHISVPNDAVTLARMAFGYSVELAPIDILMFYNAIANDGKMIRPILVKGIQESGKTIKHFETETVKSSICKASTLADIRTCLTDVVWDNEMGTASVIHNTKIRKAQSKRVPIAGKTGTAQLLINSGYTNLQHRMSFVGYFPMDNPQYTCICVIENPRANSHDAGFHCGQTVRRIAEKTIAYESIISSKTLYLHPDSVKLPTIKRGMQNDIERAVSGVDIDVLFNDSEWIRVNEDYEAEPLKVVDNLVPNVIGMGAKDAVFAIEQTGMYVKLSGKGRVRKQSVPSGSRVVRGGTVYLELR